MSIGSDSITLEPFVTADRESLIRLWTDPAVRAYLGGVLAREAAEARADDVLGDIENARAIRHRANHGERMLGMVTLGTHCDLNESEVSYLLLSEFCGHGYASAAVARACERAFAKRNTHRIIAETQSANLASVRLLARLGFELLYVCERFGAQQSVYALNAPTSKR